LASKSSVSLEWWRYYSPVNNVIIVTGGSRGIGAATAKLAAERGYAVCVNYRKRAAEASCPYSAAGGGAGRRRDVASGRRLRRSFATCAKGSLAGWSTTPASSKECGRTD
jgi:NAD(P)-dependent dehydrogenase (short-subunit alcohol dehydrogenase family)